MLFDRHNSKVVLSSLMINNNLCVLAKASTVKFLGVTLNENLIFNDHVNKVSTKISKSVGVMTRLHCKVPADVMVKLYDSMVYSLLTCASLAWIRSGGTKLLR